MNDKDNHTTNDVQNETKDLKTTNSPIRIQINNQDIDEDQIIDKGIKSNDNKISTDDESKSSPIKNDDEDSKTESSENDNSSVKLLNDDDQSNDENKNDENKKEGDDCESNDTNQNQDSNEQCNDCGEQKTNKSGLIVARSRLNLDNQSPNTNSSDSSSTPPAYKPTFTSAFTDRKSKNNESNSTSCANKGFVLTKSRLADVTSGMDNADTSNSSSSGLKVTLKPSVLKVDSGCSDQSINSDSNGVAGSSSEPSLFFGKDAFSKNGSETAGSFRFTPLSSVFRSKLKTTDTELTDKEEEIKDKNVSIDKADQPTSVGITAGSGTFSVASSTSVGVAVANDDDASTSADKSKNNSTFTSTFSVASTSSGSGGFVFGQNLEERVTNVAKDDEKKTQEPVVTPTEITTIITEKRKYENITGEEDESNVMQIFCKLYQWDSESRTWKEKGKGNLRLNDRFTDDKTSSRLIMRTSGSYKLILNCLLVHGMKFEVTNNCLRFSTVDGVHIIKGKASDIELLHGAVDQRLRDLPKRVKADEDDTDEKQEEEQDLAKSQDTSHEDSFKEDNSLDANQEASAASVDAVSGNEQPINAPVD